MSNPVMVNGDILTPNTSGQRVIVCHQVNCQGYMGAGLALQVRKKHPNVFRLYKEKCELIADGVGGLGDVQFCSCISTTGYIVANVFGQNHCGRDRQYTDYKALRTAFQHIAAAFPSYTVRIPYMMGCGLGGGDWNIMLKIVDDTLIANDVKVEIWKR